MALPGYFGIEPEAVEVIVQWIRTPHTI